VCNRKGESEKPPSRIRDRWWLELREISGSWDVMKTLVLQKVTPVLVYSFFRYQLGNLPGAYALIFSMGASSVPFEAAVRIYSRRSRPIPSRLSPSYPLYCFHRRSALDFRAGASLRSCASHPVGDVADEGEDTTPTASQHRADTAEGSGHAATQMNAARANPAAIPVAQANAAMMQVQRSSSAIENRFVIPILPAKAVTSLAIKGLPQPNEKRQPPITRLLLSTRASGLGIVISIT
jgi:hypothetical protein